MLSSGEICQQSYVRDRIGCSFYSSEENEPVHVHVKRENKITKIWSDLVRICNNFGFNRSEPYKILKLVEQNEDKIKEVWNAFFGY